MHKRYIWVLLFIIPGVSQAQLGNLFNKAKNKVEQALDRKADNKMDQAIDKVQGKPEAVHASQSTAKTETEPATTSSVQGFSKFDFVPGEKIIYTEDFSQDAIGELPLTWNSSGKGEVMTVSNQKGKWLRIFQNNTYLAGNKKGLGENYTVEFDLMFYFEPKVKGYVLPGWDFGFFYSGKKDPSDNTYLQQRSDTNSVNVKFGYGSYAMSQVESKVLKGTYFLSDLMKFGEPMKDYNKVVHYSVQVQKTRLRVWMNETKIFDIPRAISTENPLNGLFFKMDNSNYKDDEIGMFVSNIKIATGLPDTRHKLIDEGKFSTTGILFDVNEATIKPESNGVLKEIAEAIKTDQSIKVKIIGHTDGDGDAAKNLDLSKRRAEAVKQSLVSQFGIDAGQLQTDGKGKTQPVGDNKTKEGKAQNRRVEFIKI